jgi:hypothetical protein
MLRRFTLFAVALAAVLTLAGCKRGGGVGLSLPRYPGADYHPQGKMDRPTHEMYRAMLTTPDTFKTVVDFYVTELSKLPGWSGPKAGSDLVIWASENMNRGAMTIGDPIDPSKYAGGVVIQGSPDRTLVTLYESYPKPAK